MCETLWYSIYIVWWDILMSKTFSYNIIVSFIFIVLFLWIVMSLIIGETREIKSIREKFKDLITKFDIKNFSRENDFGLWRIGIEVIFLQQGCVDAIKGKENMSMLLSRKVKNDMINKVINIIILYFVDKALRKLRSREILQQCGWILSHCI